MHQDGPMVFAQGGTVLLMNMDQHRLDWSHKAAAEGESAWACLILIAYGPAVQCSGATKEEGQLLPIVVHTV